MDFYEEYKYDNIDKVEIKCNQPNPNYILGESLI